MDPVILDQIEFNPSPGKLFKKLRIKKGSKHEELIRVLVKEISSIARPKAMYTITGIDEINETGVVLGGIPIESRVMRVNLSEVHRVFPYISTSGKELYDWTRSKNDILEQYCAEEISQMALRTAGDTLLSHLKVTYQLGKTR